MWHVGQKRRALNTTLQPSAVGSRAGLWLVTITCRRPTRTISNCISAVWVGISVGHAYLVYTLTSCCQRQQNFKGPFYLLAKQFVHFGFLVCVWVTWSSAQIPPRRCTSSSVHIDWSTTSIAVFRLLNRLVVSVATKKKKSSAAFCFLALFGAALSASIQLKWLVCNVRPHRKELIHPLSVDSHDSRTRDRSRRPLYQGRFPLPNEPQLPQVKGS